MTVKLITIGDSVSQGFMSGAAAFTEFSYSTLLARTMGWSDHTYLEWKKDCKLKIDLEGLFRHLEYHFGPNIRGLEWLRVAGKVNEFLDESEDYYERGEGKTGTPVPGGHTFFHNLAVEGMDVADAWLVTPKLCRETIEKVSWNKRRDNYLKPASAPFYRNAYRVLNPSARDEYDDFSAIKWLRYHATTEGVENAIVWLGANNALGTVISLDIRPSPGNTLHYSRAKRQEWNLWRPSDFEEEYRELIRQVDDIMRENRYDDWHVFVGTVPYVTIAPLAKGMGEHRYVSGSSPDTRELEGLYYQYYSYFPFTEELAERYGKVLKFRDALHIDKTIAAYNRTIRQVVKEVNSQYSSERYHIVDLCSSLKEMAWKRNRGEPTYEYPDYFRFLYPPLDTKYYHVNRAGEIKKGGIFSLDGIHPTVIGQGLIAWEFLKKIKETGVAGSESKIDWDFVFKSDTLWNQPIKIMEEIYENDKLLQMIVDMIRIFRISI